MTLKAYFPSIKEASPPKIPLKPLLNSTSEVIPIRKKKFALVFKDDGSSQELTEEALQIAQAQGINLSTLKLKQLQDFQEPGVSEPVQKVRYSHYLNKRKKNLMEIEMIMKQNRGILQNDYSTNPHQQRSIMRSRMYSVQTMARRKNSKQVDETHILSPYKNEGNKVDSVMNEEPDIPLREPLDFDYRLNRKLAKQLYINEKKEKIKENKQKLYEEKEKKLYDLELEYAQRQKKLEKQKKEINERKAIRIHSEQQRRQQKWEINQKLIEDKEHFLRKKEEQLEQEHQKFQQQKEEKKLKQQEELFLLDLERKREEWSRTGKTFQQKKKEQREIGKRLENIENKIKRHELCREQEVKQMRDRIQSHNQRVNLNKTMIEQYEPLSQYQMQFIKKDLERMKKSTKYRQNMINEKVEHIQEQSYKKNELVQERLRHKEIQDKEKQEHLLSKDHQRLEQYENFKDAWKEEIDQRKEIAQLRKMDQQENLQRSKNFYNLYKQKLMEKIQDKMSRGDQVIQSKNKVKEAYNTYYQTRLMKQNVSIMN